MVINEKNLYLHCLYACIQNLQSNIVRIVDIKAAMYPVIFQRSKLHPFRGFAIRPLWETVPVFDDEISVSGQGVTFVHQGEIDKENLLVRLHL